MKRRNNIIWEEISDKQSEHNILDKRDKEEKDEILTLVISGLGLTLFQLITFLCLYFLS